MRSPSCTLAALARGAKRVRILSASNREFNRRDEKFLIACAFFPLLAPPLQQTRATH
jgi:hypothetical protein